MAKKRDARLISPGYGRFVRAIRADVESALAEAAGIPPQARPD